tara:strand:- start:41 stop:835 length:795 start_codon:yes stop_codon:yes gene_type:complete
MASKTLRLPKGNEWKKLPRSKAQAIDRGLNRFIGKDGQLREIRRFGTSRYPQGTVERWSSRSQNRGGGTGGTRQLNEQLATPPWADKTKFSTAMSDANAMGLDGDHIREISRTAEGIRWLESTGRGTAEQMFASYEKAGLPLGNQAGNVQPLDPKLNQQVKPAELRAMDESIKRAGRQSDAVFKGLRTLNGAIRFGDTVQTGVDIFQQGQTGSELDQAVQEPFAKVQNPFEASAKARARGGKTTVGTVTLPELGLSEFFMPPKQ